MFIKGDQALILIGFDFSLRASDLGGPVSGLPFGYLGRGRAFANRIKQLRTLTRKAKQKYPASALLWVLHFEPATTQQALNLLDEQRLEHAIRSEPVDALLCGHTHRPAAQKIFGNVPVFVCGTTTQHASVHGNHFGVLDINLAQGKPQFSYREFFYDAASGDFI